MGAAQPSHRRAVARRWEEFTPFLAYDVEIRRVLCSTNAIESLNATYTVHRTELATSLAGRSFVVKYGGCSYRPPDTFGPGDCSWW